MRFYDVLQLDPAVVKAKIRSAETRRDKWGLTLGMAVRSVLLVLFAIVFISTLSSLFGQDNNPMAVAMFCILLGVRFVDFNYCIRDSLVTMGVSFLLLLIGPTAANLVHPVAALFIHFISLFLIMVMTTAQPIMGNAGMYGFAYVYLTGNPVFGDSFWNRLALTGVCYVICAAIFCLKHHRKNPEVRFRDIAASFTLQDPKSLWQLRMALGVSLSLFLGALLHIERYMWMCFAVSSLLSIWPMANETPHRGLERFSGVVGGSLFFLLLYHLTPPSFHSFFGPLGGLLVGFCGTYPFRTVMNCLGALMIAAPIYGGEGAVLLRIGDNALGILFALLTVTLFRKLVVQRYTSAKVSA